MHLLAQLVVAEQQFECGEVTGLLVARAPGPRLSRMGDFGQPWPEGGELVVRVGAERGADGTQALDDRPRVGEAGGWVLGQQPTDQLTQRGWHVGRQGIEVGWPLDMAAEDLGVGATEGLLAGQALIKHAAQGVEIGRR